MMTAKSGDAATLRIDRLLWFLRLVRSRSVAQAMVQAGHMRLNGRRVTRAATGVRIGDTIVLPLGSAVAVLRIVCLPQRRGPAAEAQSCYLRLDRDGFESDSQESGAIDLLPSGGIGGDTHSISGPDDRARQEGARSP